VRRFSPGFIFLLVLLFLSTGIAYAQTFPDVQGYVNDFAQLLSPQAKLQLESQLSNLEKDTTAQVAVVTVKSLEGITVEEYASKLFEKWGIGQKGKDNGILVLVALEDRKMRIEVGYGLEPIITDGRAGRIRDEHILPAFKNNAYEKGIVAGINAIENYIREGTPPAPLEDNPVRDALDGFFPALIVITIVGIYLFGFMARSKTVWLGAIFGGLAGVILGLTLGSVVAVAILGIVSAGFGSGLDFLLSKTYRVSKASGKPTSWINTWGGFGGGSSGGGGFGGFGGGSSGGGGASGSW
jgi:uncharacterized protein